jgi:EamA domain-containing membrane protein RarD
MKHHYFMKTINSPKSRKESLSGAVYASSAFLIWGLSPIYWKVLHNIPALEIIMHRVIWSFLFLLIILIFHRHWNEFTAVIKKPRTILILLLTTALLGFNWFIYIWAVNNEHILQASLGYFINPLINVLLGTAFLTAFPLLLFTLGTKRLNLSTIGFLQYISPCCMFLLGVFLYNEPISIAQIFAFVLIWTALFIYSTDAARYYRRIKNLPDLDILVKL